MATLRTISRNGQAYVLADHEPDVAYICDYCGDRVNGDNRVSVPVELTIAGVGRGTKTVDAHPDHIDDAIVIAVRDTLNGVKIR